MTVALGAQGIGDRRAALALALALSAALVAWYWLDLRPIPVDYDCGDAEPPGQAAALAAYRAAAPLLHLTCALSMLAALVALSHRRMRARGEHRPGRPTAIAAALCALVAIAGVVMPEPVGVIVLVVGLVGLVSSGLPAIVALGCLVAGAIGTSKAAHWATTTGLWIAVLLGVPYNALLVYLQGNGPILC